MKVAMIARAWRTPLGSTLESGLARLLAGERAVTTDPRGAGYTCTAVAPILEAPKPSRQSRFLRRMGLYGLEVAVEALAASGISGGARIGLFSGVGGLRAHWDDMMGAFEHQRDDGERMWERGLKDVHPYWMLRHLSNNVHAIASVELALKGEGATFGGGNGGAQALTSASRALHDGAIDAALVLGHDSLLEPETLVELGARRSATHAEASRVAAPYAAEAAGFIPGEAAAAIVLVRDAAAPLAWLDATTAVGDAGLARCARRLGAGAQIVDGAARAWPDDDAAERAMLAEVVGADAPLVALSSAMGQLGAATAIVQAIALSEQLRANRLAPIASLDAPAAGPLVPITRGRETSASVALGLHTAAPGLASAIRVEVPR